MKSDWKMLAALLFVGIGLWANAVIPLFSTATAHAQDERVFQEIRDLLRAIESDVDDIEDGTCINRKICR